MYRIIYYIFIVFSKIPAFVLYSLSTVSAGLLYHVVRYRRYVVHKNVRESFPELTEKECRRIERRFYLHFCDIMFESLMYFGMTEKQMREHVKYIGLDQLRRSAENGRSTCIFLGHYGNWEWISSLPIHISDVSCACQLYHPLKNKTMDKVIGKSRSRFGSVNIPKRESLREIIRLHHERPVTIGFIADQEPVWNNIHLWIPFLNHPETPVFTGAERIARKLDMDVYYFDIRQLKRGYYQIEIVPMTMTPNECKENEITILYHDLLEKTILRNPPLWLWSHNRWKRTKSEWLKMCDPKTGKVHMD